MDYNESVVSGKSWQRSNRVIIENPYAGIPAITFVEETAVQLGESVLVNPCGTITEVFDPLKEFPIRSVAGEFTGETMSHGMLYVIINSLYRHLAEIRDAEQ